jgi:hypothetical protein
VDHGWFFSIHDIENLVNFLPNFIQFYTRKTWFSKISQIFRQKNDQICREEITNVNKERWVGKEIQNCRLQNNALSCEFAKPFLDKGKSHKCMGG